MATIITSRNYNKEVLNIIKNIIPGCKNIEQIESNVKATELI